MSKREANEQQLQRGASKEGVPHGSEWADPQPNVGKRVNPEGQPEKSPTTSHQRGGSGSEGGFPNEESYGSEGDLSPRGGGTGQRETETWSGDQKNDESKANDKTNS